MLPPWGQPCLSGVDEDDVDLYVPLVQVLLAVRDGETPLADEGVAVLIHVHTIVARDVQVDIPALGVGQTQVVVGSEGVIFVQVHGHAGVTIGCVQEVGEVTGWAKGLLRDHHDGGCVGRAHYASQRVVGTVVEIGPQLVPEEFEDPPRLVDDLDAIDRRLVNGAFVNPALNQRGQRHQDVDGAVYVGQVTRFLVPADVPTAPGVVEAVLRTGRAVEVDEDLEADRLCPAQETLQVKPKERLIVQFSALNYESYSEKVPKGLEQPLSSVWFREGRTRALAKAPTGPGQISLVHQEKSDPSGVQKLFRLGSKYKRIVDVTFGRRRQRPGAAGRALHQ